MFPNPASKNTLISFGQQLNETVEVEISDLSGKIVRKVRTRIQSDSLVVDLDGIDTGMYFLFIKSNSFGTKSHKLNVIK